MITITVSRKFLSRTISSYQIHKASTLVHVSYKFKFCTNLFAAELERDCCVRGYHIYQAVWHAALGETLARERELTTDRYACG